jgi:LysR family glycine cleavage system transcriptional activator
LIKQHGMLERGSDLRKFPLLESDDVPWRVWRQAGGETAWLSRSPTIGDSAGLLAAAEEGLGFALARWTLVTRALRTGSLKLAGSDVLRDGSAFYFVCPKAFLALPKVALFREWIFAAAREFPDPAVPRGR